MRDSTFHSCARTLLPALVLFLVTGCNDGIRAKRTYTTSFDHAVGSALEVTNRNGTIEVAADANAEEVVVEARLTCSGRTNAEAEQRVAEATIDLMRRDDGTLVVKPVFPGGRRNGDGARIALRLPDVNGAYLESSNGAIYASDLDGSLYARTSNGRIEVVNQAGPVDVRTSNGSIELEQVGGPVNAHSSNGGMRLELAPDQTGPFELHTSNGSITARVGQAFEGVVRLDTSNGRVTIDDRAGRATSTNVRKTSGTVVIASPEPASRISTSNGSVRFVVQ